MGTLPEELKTLKTANNTLQPEPDARLAKYGLEVERLSRRPTPARRDGALHRNSRPEARGEFERPHARQPSSLVERFVQQRVGTSEHRQKHCQDLSPCSKALGRPRGR